MLDSAPLLQVFRGLKGEKCWSMIANGSRLSLRFGDPVPVQEPLRNPQLTAKERHFDGTYTLFIETRWTITDGKQLRCEEADFRPLPKQYWKDVPVLKVSVRDSLRAVQIQFPKFTLRIQCGTTDSDCYSISDKQFIY